MASRKAPTCRVHINVRARRRSVVNFMPGACYPVPRVGTSSGSALPAPPSGGHVRPGFVGPGFPEDRGEEIGGGRGPAGRPELVAPLFLRGSQVFDVPRPG